MTIVERDGLWWIENRRGDVMGADHKWHSQPGDAVVFESEFQARQFALYQWCGLSLGKYWVVAETPKRKRK